ncbi:hypothetical protein GJ496_009945 [Pomphorhynchus laevis]|nr:hypothetical protein GJ496_009945 [Pomphorhynchus laevis]
MLERFRRHCCSGPSQSRYEVLLRARTLSGKVFRGCDFAYNLVLTTYLMVDNKVLTERNQREALELFVDREDRANFTELSFFQLLIQSNDGFTNYRKEVHDYGKAEVGLIGDIVESDYYLTDNERNNVHEGRKPWTS